MKGRDKKKTSKLSAHLNALSSYFMLHSLDDIYDKKSDHEKKKLLKFANEVNDALKLIEH